MRQQYTYDCICGKTHTSPSTQTPSGWIIGRNGMPVCDDCISAERTRRQPLAA